MPKWQNFAKSGHTAWNQHFWRLKNGAKRRVRITYKEGKGRDEQVRNEEEKD